MTDPAEKHPLANAKSHAPGVPPADASDRAVATEVSPLKRVLLSYLTGAPKAPAGQSIQEGKAA